MSQPDQFDKAMERLGNNIEKSASAVEKGATLLGKVQQGCLLLFVNLFLCAFLGWGGYAAFASIQWEFNGETAPAIVTRINESNDPELGRRYTSVVEYAVDGRTYSTEVGDPSIPAEHSVGETVTVRYMRDDPQTAEIENSVDRWLFPLIIIPAMLITAVVLNFRVVRAWRRGEDAGLDFEN